MLTDKSKRSMVKYRETCYIAMQSNRTSPQKILCIIPRLGQHLYDSTNTKQYILYKVCSTYSSAVALDNIVIYRVFLSCHIQYFT